jgi:hypothetical protein
MCREVDLCGGGRNGQGDFFRQVSLFLERMSLRTVRVEHELYLELSLYAHNCDALRSNFTAIISRLGE